MPITKLSISDIEFTILTDNNVFGDGTHETTKNVLKILENCDLKDKTVLDVGTGSGILSVYSGKREAKSITAIDLDKQALEWARSNLILNGVEARTLCDDLATDVEEKFDIVIANLPCPCQVENMKTISKNMNEDGLLIISWDHRIPLSDFNKNFEVAHYIEGIEYDAYALKIK